MLGLAIAITSEAFKDTKDKGGHPYILHCLRVMNAVRHMGVDAMCVAVMHDLIEDTDEGSTIDYNVKVLMSLGFSSEVVYAVKALTKERNMEYNTYIHNIATNTLVREVKLADLRDNSDITRLKGLTKKDFDRMQKYHTAYTYLSKI